MCLELWIFTGKYPEVFLELNGSFISISYLIRRWHIRSQAGSGNACKRLQGVTKRSV